MTAPAMPVAPDAPRPRGRSAGLAGLARSCSAGPTGCVGVVILALFTVLAVVPDVLVGPLQTAVTARGRASPRPSAAVPARHRRARAVDAQPDRPRDADLDGHRAARDDRDRRRRAPSSGSSAATSAAGSMRVMMRIADFFLVLPTFVLAIILTAIIRDVLGTGSKEVFGIRLSLLVIVLVIGITSWSSTARIIRSQTLSLRERAFVDRARVIGASGGAHHAPAHPAERREPDHRQRRPDLRRRDPDGDDAVVRRASAIRSSRRGASCSMRRRTVGAPSLGAWWYFVPAGTVASSSSCSRSRCSGTRSTTSSTRGGGPRDDARASRRAACGRCGRASPVAGSGRCRRRRTRTRRCSVVEHLTTHFRLPSATVHAVDDVSFTLNDGEALGIAGESGLRQDDDRAVARSPASVERPDRRRHA